MWWTNIEKIDLDLNLCIWNFYKKSYNCDVLSLSICVIGNFWLPLVGWLGNTLRRILQSNAGNLICFSYRLLKHAFVPCFKLCKLCIVYRNRRMIKTGIATYSRNSNPNYQMNAKEAMCGSQKPWIVWWVVKLIAELAERSPIIIQNSSNP